MLAVPFNGPRGTQEVLRSILNRPRNAAKLLEAVGPNRIAMLRLIVGPFSFWYDVSNQLSKRGLAVSPGNAWFAVSLPPSMKVHRLIRELFDATSAEWLFDSVFEDAIKDLSSI
jgi:hypothetical protein